jgi:two-component system chemotaxis sensor kinase CheA
MAIQQALLREQPVYNLALAIDPACPMRAAAVQLVKNVLAELGEVLAVFPDSTVPAEHLDVVEFAIASTQAAELLEKKCRIPSLISNVLVERVSTAPDQAETRQLEISDDSGDVLGLSETQAETNVQESGAASIQASSAAKLRVDAERIDTVLNLVGELVIGKSMLMQSLTEFEKRFHKDPLRAKFADAMAFQARVLSDLQKSVMKIRMVPVDQMFRRFPRIVRYLAKSCAKEVALQISGEETDLDKTILDALSEPLSHLVRNSIDHGIETPTERLAAGKPAQGTVRLNAYHQGNQVVIECSDDGRGIDRYKLVSKAVETGILTHDDAERLSDAEALHLVFHPGLSTAEQVTAISGRGVGMDVAQTVVEQLKGTISIHSNTGIGTTFLLKVPLTLAIIKALMFRVADRIYAIPLASVVEIARASGNDVHRVDQREVMQLRDQVLTLVRMRQLVSSGPVLASKKIFVIVVNLGDRRFGLIVDHLLGEEELVIKAIDDDFVSTDLVSGASILGDGSVVLILNLSAVVARLGKAPELVEAATA